MFVHDIDGIDIDWRFPSKKEKDSYTKLLKGTGKCICDFAF